MLWRQPYWGSFGAYRCMLVQEVTWYYSVGRQEFRRWKDLGIDRRPNFGEATFPEVLQWGGMCAINNGLFE